jgi:hypothetical protein
VAPVVRSRAEARGEAAAEVVQGRRKLRWRDHVEVALQADHLPGHSPEVVGADAHQRRVVAFGVQVPSVAGTTAAAESRSIGRRTTAWMGHAAVVTRSLTNRTGSAGGADAGNRTATGRASTMRSSRKTRHSATSTA